MNNERNRKEVCLCAVCNEMMFQDDDLAQHIKWESDGDGVDYIELAHTKCAKSDTTQPVGYWDMELGT